VLSSWELVAAVLGLVTGTWSLVRAHRAIRKLRKLQAQVEELEGQLERARDNGR
jgi:uncharacterized membrane-anchored protein YhcB (DUF1043 family)